MQNVRTGGALGASKAAFSLTGTCSGHPASQRQMWDQSPGLRLLLDLRFSCLVRVALFLSFVTAAFPLCPSALIPPIKPTVADHQKIRELVMSDIPRRRFSHRVDGRQKPHPLGEGTGTRRGSHHLQLLRDLVTLQSDAACRAPR